MPRRPRSTPDLATYSGPPLTVGQVVTMLAAAKHAVHRKTVYRWLRCGYLAGHHHLEMREWRVRIEDLRRLVAKLNGNKRAA